MKKDYKVVKCDGLSRPNDNRYVVIDPETGELLDDANGYGYKTAHKAHRGYNYKRKHFGYTGA